MTTTKRPHDDFFKLLLSMKEVIRDLTCNALEKEVAEQIDLDSLRLDPTDYRDEQKDMFARRRCCLLYTSDAADE